MLAYEHIPGAYAAGQLVRERLGHEARRRHLAGPVGEVVAEPAPVSNCHCSLVSGWATHGRAARKRPAETPWTRSRLQTAAWPPTATTRPG
jgi:hypothetical protein